RPVDAVAVAQIGCENEVAPPPARPAPNQAAPAELIASDPAERLGVGSDVRVLSIVHEEVPRRLAKGVVLALDRVVALVQPLFAPAAVGELPGLPPLGDVVLAVLHVAAAVERGGERPAIELIEQRALLVRRAPQKATPVAALRPGVYVREAGQKTPSLLVRRGVREHGVDEAVHAHGAGAGRIGLGKNVLG